MLPCSGEHYPEQGEHYSGERLAARKRALHWWGSTGEGRARNSELLPTPFILGEAGARRKSPLPGQFLLATVTAVFASRFLVASIEQFVSEVLPLPSRVGSEIARRLPC